MRSIYKLLASKSGWLAVNVRVTKGTNKSFFYAIRSGQLGRLCIGSLFKHNCIKRFQISQGNHSCCCACRSGTVRTYKNIGPFLFVSYSYDALACFARFTLKATHRQPVKAHMTSCDYDFRCVDIVRNLCATSYVL